MCSFWDCYGFRISCALWDDTRLYEEEETDFTENFLEIYIRTLQVREVMLPFMLKVEKKIFMANGYKKANHDNFNFKSQRGRVLIIHKEEEILTVDVKGKKWRTRF